MHFSQTLRSTIHPPWKDQYIDYAKLKSLLREGTTDDPQPWTESDENRFCDEILNVQLEKVAAFQAEKFRDLSARADRFGEKLRDLAPPPPLPSGDQEAGQPSQQKSGVATARLKEIEAGLDEIINEMRELKRYSATNYTGFMKIVKKHDRKRGSSYKIRPMVMISLAQRPFNSEEGYAPLANKLSMLYWAVKQQVEGVREGDVAGKGKGKDGGERELGEGEKYTAYKCGCFLFSCFVVSGCG